MTTRNEGWSIWLVCVVVWAATLFLHACPASAQHIDLGFDAGRAYSIVDGGYVPSTIPSVSLLFGPITVHTSTYFTGSRFFEQDTTVEWYSRENTSTKFSFFAYGSHYKWPGGSGVAGEVGVRYRLR